MRSSADSDSSRLNAGHTFEPDTLDDTDVSTRRSNTYTTKAPNHLHSPGSPPTVGLDDKPLDSPTRETLWQDNWRSAFKRELSKWNKVGEYSAVGARTMAKSANVVGSPVDYKRNLNSSNKAHLVPLNILTIKRTFCAAVFRLSVIKRSTYYRPWLHNIGTRSDKWTLKVPFRKHVVSISKSTFARHVKPTMQVYCAARSNQSMAYGLRKALVPKIVLWAEGELRSHYVETRCRHMLLARHK